MSKKAANYIAASAIVLFGFYFIWLLAKPESSSLGMYCLCIPLLACAIVGFVWLITQISKQGTENPPRSHTTAVKTAKKSNSYITSKESPNLADRFIQVNAGTQVRVPQAAISYSFETNASSFIKDAKKYHGLEGKSSSHVPFMQYWPTFQSFDKNQKNWYFYWRSEIRQGHYLQTDLSYIFVYIYELLCLIENPDPSKAAEQIKSIWRAYRSVYPKLDRYLPEWGGDLLAVKIGIPQGLAWWWKIILEEGIHPPDAVINMIIQKVVIAQKEAELPYNVWASLNLYHPKNKFYQRYNQEGVIDQAYLKAIHAIDEYLRSLKSQKGLLERYTASKLYQQTKWVFSSAIVPESFPRQIVFGEARNFAGSSRLGNLLTAITKYSENILRKQNRFSARLSGFELEEKFQKILDEAFATQPEKKPEEPIRITLDEKRIEALKQESEQVNDLLGPQLEREAKPLYSDIVQVRALWEKLDISAKQLLLAIYNHRIENVDQITKDIIGAQTSSFVLIDRINNLSLPQLGDRLISIENRNNIMIADDFVDEMELIAKENSPESLARVSAEPPPTEDENPWQRFLQALSAVETTLLSKLAEAGSLREEQIDEFARSDGQMGNLLIDSLNEKAIEQLGRTPFYPEDGCWFIEDEDLNILYEITRTLGE